MSAHALSTADPAATPEQTPLSVKLLRNVDVPVLALALVLFLVADLPLAGWLTGAGAWAVQRGIEWLSSRKATSADDVRTRVGLIAGSMILRGWIVAGIIIAVGLGDEDAGLAAAVLFLAVFTLHFTMTMAMRPFETPARKPSTGKAAARKPAASKSAASKSAASKSAASKPAASKPATTKPAAGKRGAPR